MVVYKSQPCSNKSLLEASSMMLFMQGIKMDIIENRSTSTNTQTFPCLVEGNLYRYSMEKTSQGFTWEEDECKSLNLDGRFGNDIINGQFDIPVNVRSKIWLVEVIMEYYQYLIHEHFP